MNSFNNITNAMINVKSVTEEEAMYMCTNNSNEYNKEAKYTLHEKYIDCLMNHF